MDSKKHDWLWYARFANSANQIDEIKEGIGFKQNHHHEYDVYGHMELAGSRCYTLSGDKILAAAGKFHDIFKPRVAKPYSYYGKMGHHFPGHALPGRELILKMDREFFENWGLDQEYMAELVGAHSIPIGFIKAQKTKKPNNGVLNPRNYVYMEKNILERLEAKPIRIEDAITLFLADTYAKGYPSKNRDLIRFAEYLYERNVDGRLKPLQISGR